MLHFFFEWLILPPANLIAELLAGVLGGLLPLVSAFFGGVGVFYLLKPDQARYPGQWWFLAAICAFLGFYSLVVTYTAFTRLPAAIFSMMREGSRPLLGMGLCADNMAVPTTALFKLRHYRSLGRWSAVMTRSGSQAGPVRRQCASQSSLCGLRKLEDGAPGRRRTLSPEGSASRQTRGGLRQTRQRALRQRPGAVPALHSPWGSGKGKQAFPRLQRTGMMKLVRSSDRGNHALQRRAQRLSRLGAEAAFEFLLRLAPLHDRLIEARLPCGGEADIAGAAVGSGPTVTSRSRSSGRSARPSAVRSRTMVSASLPIGMAPSRLSFDRIEYCEPRKPTLAMCRS